MDDVVSKFLALTQFYVYSILCLSNINCIVGIIGEVLF